MQTMAAGFVTATLPGGFTSQEGNVVAGQEFNSAGWSVVVSEDRQHSTFKNTTAAIPAIPTRGALI
jgi:hypothetical protein